MIDLGKLKHPPITLRWRAAYADDGSLVCVTMHHVYLGDWGIKARMPRGFRSDGMSIPRFFWRFISPRIDGKTVAPAIIHDWLYTSHVVTRAEADAWLREAVRVNGMPPFKAWLVWLGVRIFGSAHWK